MKSVDQLIDLSGRLAVVTGFAKGICKAIAFAFDGAGINNSKFRFQT